jgi:hypothetical protein
MDIQNLRRKLQEIVDAGEENFPKQIDLIIDLRKICPHSIEPVREVNRKHQYNCYMFAFDLMDKRQLRFTTNYEFTAYLIDHFVDRIRLEEASDGDYAIYRDSDRIKHAGKYMNSRIVSKWGKWHLWKHGFYEVPAEYGAESSFYRKASDGICWDAFLKWKFSKLKLDENLPT